MARRQPKKVIYRAGVIPFYVNSAGEIQYLFMKPSDPKYGGDLFQIAKGHIEPGESTRNAAFREAEEELGLLRENVVVFYELGQFLGRTTIFLAEISNTGSFGAHCSETGATAWLSADDFARVGRDLHKPIVRAAQAFLTEEFKK